MVGFIIAGLAMLAVFIFTLVNCADDFVDSGINQFVLTFDMVVFALILYFGFNVSLMTIGISLGLYIVVGFFYTLFILWPRWINSKSYNIENAYEKWKNDKIGNNGDFYASFEYRDFAVANNVSRVTAMIAYWGWDALYQAFARPLNGLVYLFRKSFDRHGRKIVNRSIDKESNGDG